MTFCTKPARVDPIFVPESERGALLGHVRAKAKLNTSAERVELSGGFVAVVQSVPGGHGEVHAVYRPLLNILHVACDCKKKVSVLYVYV